MGLGAVADADRQGRCVFVLFRSVTTNRTRHRRQPRGGDAVRVQTPEAAGHAMATGGLSIIRNRRGLLGELRQKRRPEWRQSAEVARVQGRRTDGDAFKGPAAGRPGAQTRIVAGHGGLLCVAAVAGGGEVIVADIERVT